MWCQMLCGSNSLLPKERPPLSQLSRTPYKWTWVDKSRWDSLGLRMQHSQIGTHHNVLSWVLSFVFSWSSNTPVNRLTRYPEIVDSSSGCLCYPWKYQLLTSLYGGSASTSHSPTCPTQQPTWPNAREMSESQQHLRDYTSDSDLQVTYSRNLQTHYRLIFNKCEILVAPAENETGDFFKAPGRPISHLNQRWSRDTGTLGERG